MVDHPVWRGWQIVERMQRGVKRTLLDIGKSSEARRIDQLGETVTAKLIELELHDLESRHLLAETIADHVLYQLVSEPFRKSIPLYHPLVTLIADLLTYTELFDLPGELASSTVARSAIWEAEDQLLRTIKVLDNFDESIGDFSAFIERLVEPLVNDCPALIEETTDSDGIAFATELAPNLSDLPASVEQLLLLPFAPELEKYGLTDKLKERLEYNLFIASGGVPGDARNPPTKLPTRASSVLPNDLIKSYLGGTPLAALFAIPVPIVIPTKTRFEHHHIVAGSGHGKTQTLQHLILHDLEAVAAGKASIVVIDSQSDLINNIAGLAVFAPGGALHGRLCHIDPTDVEWPVALNLFDVGQSRLGGYSPLDRERLLNGILELYDFVLGSLLDAGMTGKQNIIFRYLTRLLLQIPDATIHTFRELLEDDGYEKYAEHIGKLQGSARSFFENEFRQGIYINQKTGIASSLWRSGKLDF